ncbi:MAG: aldehyde ferredoxin oxidoreductase, partial [Deltaproteobacteria bacterium]|nr:aldehyde ferredoxin oxidoreductase [Deltaproteobacteria bacterium]
MASPGFAGKILKVDLTNKKIESIDTTKYEEFGGGYGTAIALFWDLCVKPGDWDLQDAYDPRNIISIMNGQVSGSGIPYAGRTSVSGLSPQGWPVNWFTRSNIGGDFGTMLKYAGWDGIVVQGRSDKPVYINIINDKVTLEDASKLWGLHTWDTQKEIAR